MAIHILHYSALQLNMQSALLERISFPSLHKYKKNLPNTL